jgi:hypothetical protein
MNFLRSGFGAPSDINIESEQLDISSTSRRKLTRFERDRERGYDINSTEFVATTSQRCYYDQIIGKNVSATQTLAFDGSPRRPSALTKLSFDFDGALANCIWFSGS